MRASSVPPAEASVRAGPAGAGVRAPGGPLGVCVITAAYPAPSEPTRAIFVENLCRELAALMGESGGPRFRVSVVAPRIRSSDPPREDRFGIPVRRFRYPSGGRRLKETGRVSPLRLAAYLASGFSAALAEVRRTGARLIHSHWVLPAGLVGGMVRAVSGARQVIHAHGSDIHRYAVSSWAARRAARWALSRAERVLAVSAALETTLRSEFGVEASRLRRLPMGIDGRVFFAGDRAAARRELGLDGGRAEMLFVGDLTPEKGALALAAQLAGEEWAGRPARLNLAGDGPERARLEELSRQAPERLRVLGRLEPGDLAAWYRAADVLVLPSLGEGAPVSVMEALASGLPVVATAVGGVPDLVRPGREGWLAPAGATAREFLRVLGEALGSPAEIERMRSRLSETGEDRTARRRARELALELEEVAGGPGGAET